MTWLIVYLLSLWLFMLGTLRRPVEHALPVREPEETRWRPSGSPAISPITVSIYSPVIDAWVIYYRSSMKRIGIAGLEGADARWEEGA